MNRDPDDTTALSYGLRHHELNNFVILPHTVGDQCWGVHGGKETVAPVGVGGEFNIGPFMDTVLCSVSIRDAGGKITFSPDMWVVIAGVILEYSRGTGRFIITENIALQCDPADPCRTECDPDHVGFRYSKLATVFCMFPCLQTLNTRVRILGM